MRSSIRHEYKGSGRSWDRSGRDWDRDELTEARKLELEELVRRREEHVVDDALAVDQMRELRKDMYGIPLHEKYVKPSQYVPDKDKWHREMVSQKRHVLISAYLLDRRNRWEEQKVSVIEVLGLLYRGDTILDTKALLEWHSYRDSSKFVGYRRATWEAMTDGQGKRFERAELDYVSKCTIQVYFERYCGLFHRIIDGHVVLQEINQVAMEDPGNIRGLEELYTKVLALWRQMNPLHQASSPIYETFKHVVLRNGGGSDSVRSGLDMWRAVTERLKLVKERYPLQSELVGLQQVLQGISTEYKDAEALNELGTRLSKKEQKPGRMRSRSIRMDEDSDAGTERSERDYIIELQREYNNLHDTVKARGAQTTQRTQSRGGLCAKCGMAHYTSTGCKYMKNGVYSLDLLADWLAKEARDPNKCMEHVITKVWPNSSLNKHRTTADAEKLRRMVAERKGKV